MIEVAAIDRATVGLWWPVASKLVDQALPFSRGRWTLDDIHDGCVDGNMRLWLIFQGDDVVCAFVTVITAFSTQKICTILLCGGSDVDAWVAKGLGQIEEYAAWEGCGQVEIIGRIGWAKKCPGFEMAGIWLVKELS